MKRPSAGCLLGGTSAVFFVGTLLYSLSEHIYQIDLNSLRGREVTCLGPIVLWTWHEGDGLSKIIRTPDGLRPKWRVTSSASHTIRWHTRLSEVINDLRDLTIADEMCPDAGFDDVIERATQMLRNEQIDACRSYLKPIALSLEQRMKNCEPLSLNSEHE